MKCGANMTNEITIKNADFILTMDDDRREINGGDIAIRNGEIIAVGHGLGGSGTQIDARNCVVTPGLVNTHHHLFQTLTK